VQRWFLQLSAFWRRIGMLHRMRRCDAFILRKPLWHWPTMQQDCTGNRHWISQASVRSNLTDVHWLIHAF